MYNVRNASGRNLAVMLEKGGSIMRPNTYLDLDKFCSRKWIASNFDLRKLIRTGYLQLVHDSYATLPSAPIKNIQRPVQLVDIPKKVVSRAPVQVVIDLMHMPDVEVDDNKHIHIPEQAKEVTVKAQDEIVVPKLVEEEEKVEHVLPVAEDPPPVAVLAVEEAAPAPVRISAPIKSEGDIFSGFDSSRTPKLKRRKR